MNKGIFLLCTLITILFSNITFADNFVDNGNGTITDADTGLMWLRNANLSGTVMNWYDAYAWADALVFAGHDDWRLPSAFNSDGSGPCGPGYGGGYNCSDSEMGHLYYIELENPLYGPLINTDPFVDLEATVFWTGTESLSDYAWNFSFGNSYQSRGLKSSVEGLAWAVRDAGIAPEPASVILFVAGGAVLRIRYVRKKRTRV